MQRDFEPTAAPVEHIGHDGRTVAVIVRANFHADGIRFFTPSSYSQQIGYMNRPRGHVIAPHVHLPVRREVHYTNEVLFVRRGRVRVDLYGADRHYLESTILFAGDVILLAEGGHGFEMLDDTEIVEVKQGPYAGDADKARFAAVPNERLRLRGSAFAADASDTTDTAEATFTEPA